jgi:hypothetical protein
VPHILRHGTFGFKVISERRMNFTSECRALCEGAITIFNALIGLTARTGLEFTTSRMLSENTTTRLPQPVF